MNPFETIPDEVVLLIFARCELELLEVFASVSRNFRRLVLDSSLRLKRKLIRRAQSEIERQAYPIGLRLLLDASRLFPLSSLLWKEIALCHKQMDNFEESCEALLKARLRAKGAFLHFLDSQLFLYVQRKGVLLAKEHINRAIAVAPDDLRYYHFRAFIEAGTKLEDTLGPNDPEPTPEESAAFHQASLQRELDDYLFVCGHRTKYDRLASIYNNIGAVYFEKQDNEAALRYFEMSLEQCATYVQAIYNKAIVWKDIRNLNLAVEEYSSILQLNPDLPRTRSLRAQCYYAMGEFVNAMADFLDSVTFDSAHFHYLDVETVRGLFLSTVHCGMIDRVPAALIPLTHKIDALLTQNRERQGRIDELQRLVDGQPNQSLLEFNASRFRLEAAIKTHEKVSDEARSVGSFVQRLLLLQSVGSGLFEFPSQSLHEFIQFLQGEFDLGIETTSSSSSVFADFMKTLTHENSHLSISEDTKRFTLETIRKCTTSNFAPIVEVLRKAWECHKEDPLTQAAPTLLVTWPEQLHFLYCYGYCYLSMHALRTRHRQEIEWKPVMDLVVWLFRKAPSESGEGEGEGEGKEVETETEATDVPPHSPLADFLVESPLSLVLLLEIFKLAPGGTPEGRSLRKTLISLAESLLPAIVGADSAANALPEPKSLARFKLHRKAHNVLQQLVETHLSRPHFRSSNF